MLVFNEVKPLVAVVPEAGVAGEKGKTLCYGVGYDDMVAWIPMFLLLIKMQARVCVAYMTTQRQELYLKVFLHRTNDILCLFPMAREYLLVVEKNNKFPHRLETGTEGVFRVIQQCYYASVKSIEVKQHVNDDACVKH